MRHGRGPRRRSGATPGNRRSRRGTEGHGEAGGDVSIGERVLERRQGADGGTVAPLTCGSSSNSSNTCDKNSRKGFTGCARQRGIEGHKRGGVGLSQFTGIVLARRRPSGTTARKYGSLGAPFERGGGGKEGGHRGLFIDGLSVWNGALIRPESWAKFSAMDEVVLVKNTMTSAMTSPFFFCFNSRI